MSESVDTQPASRERPATSGRRGWQIYWRQQEQPWRTEPEIDAERQAYLAQRRAIQPNLEEGLYPFKDITLKRADVEWLLATHEDGRGPVDWRDPAQRKRMGLDLRGADLRGADLRHLPLTRMLGGLNWRERDRTPERRDRAAVHLEGAVLSWANLCGAELYMAHLERADLYKSHLEGASLRKAHLEGVSLRKAALGNRPVFADEQEQHKPRQKRVAPLFVIPPADLRAAFFDTTTDLKNVVLGDREHGFVYLTDVHWEGVNLAVVDWSPVRVLGDEKKASRLARELPEKKEVVLAAYHDAVRANRQLSVALQGEGLNEEAARFAYRAQRLQREVSRRQGKFGTFIFSYLLDLLAGYGYKPARSLIAYLLLISSFALTYFLLGRTVGPPLSALGALVFSVTSFHGRGFFPGGIVLDDPITTMAALEAIVGLTVEISFIATFTQRFFGK